MAVPAIQFRDVADLVIGTLDNYGPPRFSQVAQNLQKVEFYGRMLKEDRMSFDGGIGIKRQVMTKLNETAEAVGLHHKSDINIEDHMAQLDVKWTKYRNWWAFDLTETFHNTGKPLVMNVIAPREANAIIGLAEKIENDGFAVPASTDEVAMYGVPYWVVYDTTDGHTGATPTGHTTVGGISPTTHPNWKNYSGTFTNMTPEDFLKVARLLRLETDFVSPLTLEDFRGDPGQRWRVYTDFENHVNYALMADQHNQNIGWDLARRDGSMALFGNSIIAVSKLKSGNKPTGVPTNPWYFLDRDAFEVATETRNYMRRTQPMPIDGRQPDSIVTWINITLQTFVTNRRSLGVMATAA
jgi:hypothetical protein